MLLSIWSTDFGFPDMDHPYPVHLHAAYQDLICDMVAVIHDYAARTDTQRIGAVVPLLALRRDRALASAADEAHMILMQIVCQHLLRAADHFLDMQLSAGSRRDLIDMQSVQNAGMHREGIGVNLGQDRVQMHEGTTVGNVKDQNGVHTAILRVKKVVRQQLNGFWLRALRYADRNDLRAQI